MYHIDPDSLEVFQCLSASGNCPKAPAKAHYESLLEAKEALSFSKELDSLSSYSPVVNFVRGYSSKHHSYFLEASLRTPFNDDVYFTIENLADRSVGSMLLAGKEYVLAQADSCLADSELEGLAKETIHIARRLHRAELWPTKSVVALYRNLSSNSTSKELIASALKLQEFESPGATQLYRGETFRGTEVSIKAAFGYAVASIEESGDSEIIYEASISRSIFFDLNERNAFAAKAFGELLELGEI